MQGGTAHLRREAQSCLPLPPKDSPGTSRTVSVAQGAPAPALVSNAAPSCEARVAGPVLAFPRAGVRRVGVQLHGTKQDRDKGRELGQGHCKRKWQEQGVAPALQGIQQAPAHPPQERKKRMQVLADPSPTP